MPESTNDEAKAANRGILLLESLAIFHGVASHDTVAAYKSLLAEIAKIEAVPEAILIAYHRFCALALSRGWPECLLDLILEDDNIFSRQAASRGITGVDPYVRGLAGRDLAILQEVAGLTPAIVKDWVVRRVGGDDAVGLWGGHEGINARSAAVGDGDPVLPRNWPEWSAAFPGWLVAGTWLEQQRAQVKNCLVSSGRWSSAIDCLAAFYARAGYGMFARYLAFHWEGGRQAGSLRGIDAPDLMCLDQLIGLQREHQIIRENTEHFLAGQPASNIILYGNRGTGKSSTVKALLTEYAHRGLRLVEMRKTDLTEFPALTLTLRVLPLKFIVFVDDLSFDEREPEYKALKTVLEGGLEPRPANVLIYATSNRRHLLKESFMDRQAQGEEVHSRDSIEEQLSLADRFGITVTFSTPDQEKYLKIVEGLAAQRGLCLERKDLQQQALKWEMWHNGRSGRTARQFIDYLTARVAMGKEEN